MTTPRLLRSKKFLIAVGVVLLLFIGFVAFCSAGKANVDVIEGGAIVRGEEWNKIIDHDLGVELAYPPDFGLTGERQGENSLHLYRQIGYGERLHCNESGEPRPHALSDPNLYLRVPQLITSNLKRHGKVVGKLYGLLEPQWLSRLS